MIFDIRHNDPVRLAKDVTYYDGPQGTVKRGTIGKVLTMRGINGHPEYLVKWVGRSCPTSVDREDIERA